MEILKNIKITLALIATLLYCTATFAASEKYEYKIEKLYMQHIYVKANAESQLNGYGKEGWELIQMIQEESSRYGKIFYLILKKKVN